MEKQSWVILWWLLLCSIIITIGTVSANTDSGMRPPMMSGAKPPMMSGAKPPMMSGAKPPMMSGAKPPMMSGAKPPIGTGAMWIEIKNGVKKQTTTKTGMEVTEELTSGVSWMYTNGLTSLSSVSTFKVDNYLTREQSAKFFVQFTEKILGTTTTTSNTSFSDLSSADSTLKSYIAKAGEMGLLKGYNGKFSPQSQLTRAQAITVIIRSIDGKLDETGTTWYESYYDKAELYGILDGLNFAESTLNSVNIKRGEVALLLYRLVTKGIVN